MRKLTEIFAETVRVPRRTYYWDRQLAGFGLRVGPTRAGGSPGRRVWVFRYRLPGQRRRPEVRSWSHPPVHPPRNEGAQRLARLRALAPRRSRSASARSRSEPGPLRGDRAPLSSRVRIRPALGSLAQGRRDLLPRKWLLRSNCDRARELREREDSSAGFLAPDRWSSNIGAALRTRVLVRRAAPAFAARGRAGTPRLFGYQVRKEPPVPWLRHAASPVA